MQKIFGIVPVTSTANDLTQQIAPKLSTDWDVGHLSVPVIFPPVDDTLKTSLIPATKIFSKIEVGKRAYETSQPSKAAVAAINGPFRRRSETAAGTYIPRTVLICLLFGLAACSVGKHQVEATQSSASPSQTRSATTPASVPAELSHDEMVREQERRDREAEDERDRDDL
jgi:hypothetical protein